MSFFKKFVNAAAEATQMIAFMEGLTTGQIQEFYLIVKTEERAGKTLRGDDFARIRNTVTAR